MFYSRTVSRIQQAPHLAAFCIGRARRLWCLLIAAVMATLSSTVPAFAQTNIVWLHCDVTVTTWRGVSAPLSQTIAIDSANNRVAFYDSSNMEWLQAQFTDSGVGWVIGPGQWFINRQSLAYIYSGGPVQRPTESGQGQCQKIDNPTAANQF
jgi:hypothetical protein